jgi:FkbM family methyltransferase
MCDNSNVLISVGELVRRFGIQPKRVLHVGGHLGEEHEDMSAYGWGKDGVFWVESQEDLCGEMRRKFANSNNTVISATVWSKSGVRMIFHENLNSQSSSLYQLGTHKDSYPEFIEINEREVITSTLDSLEEIPRGIDFMNLDVQGAELEALKGASSILEEIQWIYTEVNRNYVYKSCPLVEEVDEFLKTKGFKRVATRWSFGEHWGDALYGRKPYLKARLQFLFSEKASNILLKIRYTIHDLKKS